MRDLCWEHGERMKRHGTLVRPKGPSRHASEVGYIRIKRPGHPMVGRWGWVLEHRAVLFDAIGGDWHPCHWCKEPVSWYRKHTREAEALVVDHLDEDLHNNSRDNLVPSCSQCNLDRSSPQARARRKVNS